MRSLEDNSNNRIQGLLEQRKKELDKIDKNKDKIRSLECGIEEASKAEDAIRKLLLEENKIKAKDDNSTLKKLDKYRLKFAVKMLNEEDVINQLDLEMEEFHKLLDLQIKELHPARQRLVNKITEIIKQYNPAFEVTFTQIYRSTFMDRMQQNCVYRHQI